MSRIYTFNTPQVVGDVGNQVTITSMKIASFACNLNATTQPGNAVLSIVLVDTGTSGYQFNIIYTGTNASGFWSQVNTQSFATTDFETTILQKLKNDGKIPPGTIS